MNLLQALADALAYVDPIKLGGGSPPPSSSFSPKDRARRKARMKAQRRARTITRRNNR